MKYIQASANGSVGDDRVIAWPRPGASAVPYGRSGGLTEVGTDHCRVGTQRTPQWKQAGKNSKCQSAAGCLFNISADAAEEHNLLSGPSLQYKGVLEYLSRFGTP